MVVFVQNRLYSVKVNEYMQKWLYSSKSGCNPAKMAVFDQGGCIRSKWLYSSKIGRISAKMVVFDQSGCIRSKVVVFGQKRF